MITFIVSGLVKKAPLNHNHQADIASIEAAKAIEAVKQRSTQTDEVTYSVIQHSTSSISIAAAVKLPSKESLSKIVRRKRSTLIGQKYLKFLLFSIIISYKVGLFMSEM